MTTQSQNTSDKISVIDILKTQVPDKPIIDFENTKKNLDNNLIIKIANNEFLNDTLSPELRLNEKMKRIHKSILIGFMVVFLTIQFIVVGKLVFTTINSIIEAHRNLNDYNTTTLTTLFGFISTYITSVIVELYVILKTIVLKVFDESIVELVKVIKSDNEDK